VRCTSLHGSEHEDAHPQYVVRYLVFVPEEARSVGDHESTGFKWLDQNKIHQIDPDNEFLHLVECGPTMFSRLQLTHPHCEY